MARLPALDRSTLSDEQKSVYDAIADGPRGGVRGPLAVWLRRPHLANTAQALGRYCRYDSSLSNALSELAILVTAREWGSEYEWFAHKKFATAAGLPLDLIEAIRTRNVFAFTEPTQHVVFDVATALYRDRRLSDALYARALAVLGEDQLIDLVGVLGYYALISMTINAFEVDLPEGAAKELAP
jgi:4-carboxymuconolactone decarboxylase